MLGWTVWLIPLNIVPNDTVNRVMNTTTFDYGSFWLMVDPPQALKIVAALGLVLVAGGYLVILVRMAKCRRNVNVKQALDSRSQPDFLTKIENALEAAASSLRGTNYRLLSRNLRPRSPMKTAKSKN